MSQIPECCRNVNEEEICKNESKIISAFDDIVHESNEQPTVSWNWEKPSPKKGIHKFQEEMKKLGYEENKNDRSPDLFSQSYREQSAEKTKANDDELNDESLLEEYYPGCKTNYPSPDLFSQSYRAETNEDSVQKQSTEKTKANDEKLNEFLVEKYYPGCEVSTFKTTKIDGDVPIIIIEDD